MDPASENYSELIQSQCFYNLIQSPTRIGETKISILDHIIVKNSNRPIKSCTLDFDISDHKPVFASFVYKKHSHNFNKNPSPMNIAKTNYVLLQEIIQRQNWSHITEISDTNTAFKLFIEKLSSCVDDASNKISARKHQRSILSRNLG